jgi:hypothetical protein
MATFAFGFNSTVADSSRVLLLQSLRNLPRLAFPLVLVDLHSNNRFFLFATPFHIKEFESGAIPTGAISRLAKVGGVIKRGGGFRFANKICLLLLLKIRTS